MRATNLFERKNQKIVWVIYLGFIWFVWIAHGYYSNETISMTKVLLIPTITSIVISLMLVNKKPLKESSAQKFLEALKQGISEDSE